jgi:hypothetical protein
LFAALTLKTASTKKARALRPGAGMPAYAPTAKERKIVERTAGFAYRRTKSASSLCPSARASQSGSTQRGSQQQPRGVGMRSIPPLRNPFLRRVTAEFVVVGDL